MSVAVVSPAASTPVPRQTRVATSSAAQAYAALQQDSAQQTGQIPQHHHRHGDKTSASSTINPAKVSSAKPTTGGALNILA